METIRINNKFKNNIYSELFHCYSIILTNKHNVKLNDVVNIQLVNPIKDCKNKIGKIYRIEKCENAKIDKYPLIHSIEEMSGWQLGEYFRKNDELTIIYVEDVRRK